tara:strand:- start:79 stop:189 length:111 start_codon:yes stop_codon:yes gene_type:complete
MIIIIIPFETKRENTKEEGDRGVVGYLLIYENYTMI